MFDMFPEWFQIFFGSMIPWIEGRYIVVYAMEFLKWPWWRALPIAIIGNFIPVPFVLLFFKHIEKFLRKFKTWCKIMDWCFEKTRKRADAKIKRYEHIGLLLFVAIPLPFTGAWTGSLIAYLFDLKFTRSLITIFIGIVIACFIMVFITIMFGNIFGYTFNG